MRDVQLTSKKREIIVIGITPEMIKRVQELNISVVEEIKKSTDFALQSREMQNASMQMAIELGN